jgi:hypothetical protein
MDLTTKLGQWELKESFMRVMKDKTGSEGDESVLHKADEGQNWARGS